MKILIMAKTNMNEIIMDKIKMVKIFMANKKEIKKQRKKCKLLLCMGIFL
jgi:hypothetical protein